MTERSNVHDWKSCRWRKTLPRGFESLSLRQHNFLVERSAGATLKTEDYFINYPYAQLGSQDGLARLRFCTYSYELPRPDLHRNFIQLMLPSFKVELDDL